jgi:hypothetical protein
MIIQIANIVSGFALAAPKLAEFGGKEAIEKVHGAMMPHMKTIGVIELILGLVALIDRMGILTIPIMNLGSSYPQALPAILIGLVLGGGAFLKNEALSSFVTKLEPYRMHLGIIGIAVGLGSILFGCILCSYWYQFSY